MNTTKAQLIKPLFYNGNFNRQGRKMRAVFLKEVSDGENIYPLYIGTGQPDREYPRDEKDKYIIHVLHNGYLIPLQMTESHLIDECGFKPAVENLYGSIERRQAYFDSMISEDNDMSISDVIAKENDVVRQYGNDQKLQAAYIKSVMDFHIEGYMKSRNNNGESFPDFIGACWLDELPLCVELSGIYKENRIKKHEAEAAEIRRQDKALVAEKNEIANKMISDAINTITNGGTLSNDTVSIYTLTPDAYTVKEYSIINYLMREYGINVPLRTLGWIIEKLTAVEIKDGNCCGARWRKVGNSTFSSRFFEYMEELVKTVCNREVDNESK